MDFFREMLFTASVALLFSFFVAKLVSLTMAGNSGCDTTSNQAEKHEIGVGDDFVTVEELRLGMKMDARVVQSERNFRVVDENVEPVDRFGAEADRVDELQEVDNNGGELVVPTEEAVSSLAADSPESEISKEMIVRGEDERSGSAEEGSAEREELMVRTTEADPAASVSPENVVTEEIMIREQDERSKSTDGRSACVENEESGDALAAESEEVSVEESNTAEESENKMELNTEEESETMEASKEKEELSIEEEDDDWEGIERTELEKAFASASKFLEESGKSEDIGAEAKMELYGLHKIATEGSCREAQPLAVMVSARAKWNAWQKLGNMSQEEAMEQYLALASKEIPGLMNTGHTVGKIPEIELSALLPANSGSLEDPTTLDTTGVGSSKNGER